MSDELVSKLKGTADGIDKFIKSPGPGDSVKSALRDIRIVEMLNEAADALDGYLRPDVMETEPQWEYGIQYSEGNEDWSLNNPHNYANQYSAVTLIRRVKAGPSEVVTDE